MQALRKSRVSFVELAGPHLTTHMHVATMVVLLWHTQDGLRCPIYENDSFVTLAPREVALCDHPQLTVLLKVSSTLRVLRSSLLKTKTPRPHGHPPA